MKKLFTSLLLAVSIFMTSFSVVATAAYQKLNLSEQVVMDSGRVNIVEWEQLKGEGSGEWGMQEIDPTVTNLPGTGSSMIIEPYATADLSKGDVTLSFDILVASNVAVGAEYSTHLYALIEPEEGAAFKDADGSLTNYYCYLHDGALTSPYSYSSGGHMFYSDKACTKPVEYTADFTLFSLGAGRMSFTYTKDRVIGVSLATANGTTTVYIKDAFPASYTSGNMRFGLHDWGIFKIDNLVLSQNEIIVSTDFSEGYDEVVATSNITLQAKNAGGETAPVAGSPRVKSVSDGSVVGYLQPVVTADLTEGDVTLSVDISGLSSEHLYAIVEDGATATTSGALSKIAKTGTQFYAHMYGGLLVADYSYYDAGERTIFYQDAECTTPYTHTADFLGWGLFEGTLSLIYKANGTLGVVISNGTSTYTAYVKNAFPAQETTGEKAFGIAFWSGVTFDNLKLTQNGTVLCENDFSGDWKNLVGNEIRADQTADVDNVVEDEGEEVETNVYAEFLATGDMAVVESKVSADLSKGDVSLSFDVLDYNNAAGGDGVRYGTHLYAIAEPKDGASIKWAATGTDYYLYLNGGAITSPYAYAQENGQIYYLDRECTVPATQTADYALFNFGEGRMTITFCSNRAIGVSLNGQTYYVKNALPEAYVNGEMLFGIADWGILDIDNLEISQPKVIMQTGFEKGWSSATAEEGKCYSSAVKTIAAGGLASTNTNESQRLVLRSTIDADEDCDIIFSAKGSLAFETLNDNFGFAMGMDAKDSALADSNFLYFYTNEDGKTHLALGETDYSLNDNLVGQGAIVIELDGYANGKLIVNVNEVNYEFDSVDMNGYFAILSEGKGNATVIVGQAFEVVNYAYRGSEGGEIAENFNTGAYDSDNWTMQNLKANYLNEADRANGITFENGRLNYDGVGIMSYFATTKAYSEYILEFDYIQPADLPTTYANAGYLGAFAICVASNSSSGYNNSHMFTPFYYDEPGMGFIQWANCTSGAYETGSRLGSWNYYDAEKDIVTAMKVVVAFEQVSIYVQDITETDFNKDNYVLQGTWDVGDTYGYVCLAGDEGAVQYFDNIRITPIDDPDIAKVQEKIDNFEDRRAIEDYCITLATPEVIVNGQTITWNKVKEAQGYIVTVNGEAKPVQTATEYTFEEEGTYTVTVQAVGEGAWIKANSEQSAEVQVVVGEQETESNPSDGNDSNDNTSSGGGCLGSVGFSGVFSLLALGAVAILRKKKD